MTYLVYPYSSPDATIRQQRFESAKSATLRLIQRGGVVFSPIVYGHQFSDIVGVSFTDWKTFDLAMLDAADSVAVLMLDGWRESVWVQAELRHARATGKTVVFLDPVTLEPVDTDERLLTEAADKLDLLTTEIGEWCRAARDMESVDDESEARGASRLSGLLRGNSYANTPPSVAERLMIDMERMSKTISMQAAEINRLTAIIDHGA